MAEPIDPIGGPAMRHVQVFSSTVRIHELTVNRPNVAAYLDRIAPDKLELALIHALDVGVAELAARRQKAS
jgi:hypothetical protein